MRHTLVLASASPARVALLRAAGFAPRVMVSGVDEDGVESSDARELACVLAEAKADAVARRLVADPAALPPVLGDDAPPEPRLRPSPAAPGATAERQLAAAAPGGRPLAATDDNGTRPAGLLVVGCDTVLDFDGEVRGKPRTSTQARDWWRGYRGRQGTLVTGHAVIDLDSGRRAVAAARALIRFGSPSDPEIDAYVATGEPLVVAGAFTLDGYCAPFVTSIDGDPGTVLGLSVPLLRTLLADLGVAIIDLWAPA